MDEKMRTVECNSLDCDCVFEIPESNIKEEHRTRCILYEAIRCPKCNRKDKRVRDYARTEEARERDSAEANQPVHCPICKSTQIYAGEKGFSAGKALGGVVLTGGIGLLAGFHNSKKILLTCLKCGKKWEAGK